MEKEINEKIEKELGTFKTKFNEAFKEFTEDDEKCFSEVTKILNELYKKSDTIISLKYSKDKEGLIKNDYNSLKNNLIQENLLFFKILLVYLKICLKFDEKKDILNWI